MDEMRSPITVSHVEYQFTDDQIKDIKSMWDFYKATGLAAMVENKTITNVWQIWMNQEQCEGLRDIVKANLVKTRRFRSASQKYLDNSVAMDWLNYSPVSAPYVPAYTLWVFGQDQYTEAVDQHRQWIKENEGREDKL